MLRRRPFPLLAAILAVPALLTAEPELVGGQQKPKKEVTCRAFAGFGPQGFFRVGGWVGIRLRLQNTTEEDVTLKPETRLELGEDWASATFEGAIVDLPRGGLKTASFYVRPVQPVEGVQVGCLGPRGFLVCGASAPLTPVEAGRALLVMTGPCALGALPSRNPGDAAVQLLPEELPDRPEGYDGVDWVLLRGAEWASSPKSLEAITRWLEGGGRLAVSGAEALRALEGSPIGKRLALTLGEPAPVSAVRALQSLAGDDLNLPAAGTLCERIACRGAVPLVSSGATPLVLKAGLGSGEILLYALDPEVFRGQPGYWGLWARTLGLPAKAKEEDLTFTGSTPSLGWAKEVLDSSLYHKEPIRLDWIWAFLGIYVLVVGPADYFLVKRLRRWRLAGLFTLGSWAILASLACYHLGSSGRFSNTVISRVAALDAFPRAGRVSGRSLLSLYQSGNALFHAGVPWGEGSASVVMDPAALDKSGLLKGEALNWQEDARLLGPRDVPVYVGTQKVFETRWDGSWKELGIVLEKTPSGGWRLENRSKLILLPASGGAAIEPGDKAELASPDVAAVSGEENGIRGLCAVWMSTPPKGLPVTLAPRDPQPCFAFWVEGEGIPLGLEGATPSVSRDAVLLRIYPD